MAYLKNLNFGWIIFYVVSCKLNKNYVPSAPFVGKNIP